MNKLHIISLCLAACLCACVALPATYPAFKTEVPVIPGPYYQPENSGAGFRLAITPPAGAGIEEKDEYLPGLIQGLLSSNFNKFSRFTLLRLREHELFDEEGQVIEEEIIVEEISPSGDITVSEIPETEGTKEDIGTVVKFINYDYLIGGTLTALKDREFRLVLTITDVAEGKVVATYTENGFTVQDVMEGLIANASQFLLEKAGVVLLDAGKEALTAEAPFNAELQAKLARSRAALNQDKTISALVYAYGAEGLRQNNETTDQLKTASEALSTGNVGTREVILSDYQQQQRWLEQLIEFETFYRDNSPFDLFYTVPEKKGETNYSTGTVDLEFLIGLQPSGSFNTMQKIIKDISKELNKTKNRKRWGFEEWPVKSREYDIFTQRKFALTAGLYNGNNIEIKRVTVDLQTQLMCKNDAIFFDSLQRIPAVFKDVIVGDLIGDLTIKLLTIDNGVNVIDMKDAMEDGNWTTYLVSVNDFPIEKRATIPASQRTISRQPATIAPIKQAPKPKSTSFEDSPLKDKRVGASVSALLNPFNSKNAALSATIDGGFGGLTAEFITHFSFNDDYYKFAIGGGAGYSLSFLYALTSLTFGATYVSLPENESVIPMYFLLKADILPFKKWGAVRFGFLMEMGSTKWGDAYYRYFRSSMNSGDFRLNGKFFTGLVFWYS